MFNNSVGKTGEMAQGLRALTGFNSQHPHGGSQPSVSPVLEDLTLHGNQARSCTDIDAGKTDIHVK